MDLIRIAVVRPLDEPTAPALAIPQPGRRVDGRR